MCVNRTQVSADGRLDKRNGCLRTHMCVYACICMCVSGICELWEALDSRGVNTNTRMRTAVGGVESP